MKEKSSKKESIKKEAKQEGRDVTAFVRSESRPTDVGDLKVRWDDFIRFFNATLTRYGSAIPPLEYLSKGMKSRIQSLVNQWNTKKALIDACEKLAKSDFLNGRIKGVKSGKPFKATFFWMVEKNEHFEKVLSGYYDNTEAVEPTAEELRKQEEEERKAKEAERRALAKQIEEEERAERHRRMEEAERNKATPEELQEIFARINRHMPPAKH